MPTDWAAQMASLIRDELARLDDEIARLTDGLARASTERRELAARLAEAERISATEARP